MGALATLCGQSSTTSSGHCTVPSLLRTTSGVLAKAGRMFQAVGEGAAWTQMGDWMRPWAQQHLETLVAVDRA